MIHPGQAAAGKTLSRPRHSPRYLTALASAWLGAYPKQTLTTYCCRLYNVDLLAKRLACCLGETNGSDSGQHRASLIKRSSVGCCRHQPRNTPSTRRPQRTAVHAPRVWSERGRGLDTTAPHTRVSLILPYKTAVVVRLFPLALIACDRRSRLPMTTQKNKASTTMPPAWVAARTRWHARSAVSSEQPRSHVMRCPGTATPGAVPCTYVPVPGAEDMPCRIIRPCRRQTRPRDVQDTSVLAR